MTYKIYLIMGNSGSYPGDAGPYPVTFCDSESVATRLVTEIQDASCASFKKMEAYRREYEPWHYDSSLPLVLPPEEAWELRDKLVAAGRAATYDPQWNEDKLTRYYVKELWRAGYVPYDPNHGDDKVCTCGHVYYRHFDSWADMDPVGCKYCDCDTYIAKGAQ